MTSCLIGGLVFGVAVAFFVVAACVLSGRVDEGQPGRE